MGKQVKSFSSLFFVDYIFAHSLNELISIGTESCVLLLYRWSRIARKLPGRTDNEIKNYWRSRLRREYQVHGQGIIYIKKNVVSTANSSIQYFLLLITLHN